MKYEFSDEKKYLIFSRGFYAYILLGIVLCISATVMVANRFIDTELKQLSIEAISEQSFISAYLLEQYIDNKVSTIQGLVSTPLVTQLVMGADVVKDKQKT